MGTTVDNIIFKSFPNRESASIYVVLGLLFIYISYRFIVTHFSNRKVLLGYPFLGYALTLTPTKYMEPMIDLCRKYGPVFDVYILFLKFTVITNTKDANEILSKRPKYFKRPTFVSHLMSKIGIMNGLFMSEYPDWSIHRRVTSPAFSKKALSSHIQNIWNECINSSKNIISDGKIITEFTETTTIFTVTILGLVAFGINDGSKVSYFFSKQFREDMRIMLLYASKRILFGLPEFIWRISPLYKYEKDMNIVMKRLKLLGDEIIHLERQKPLKQDIYYYLHHLVHADGELKLTNSQILENIVTVFVAGTDTTSIALSWSMYYISINKKLLSDIQNEVDILFNKIIQKLIPIEDIMNYLPLLTAVFKESLRLRGPGSNVTVQLLDDINELQLQSGLIIKKNDNVWIPYDFFNLDENIYENPENYNPYRWLITDKNKLTEMENHFYSFGYGPRICPGMALSYIEGPLFLAHLIHMYNIELACPPNEVEQIASFTTRCNKCPIIFTPRKK